MISNLMILENSKQWNLLLRKHIMSNSTFMPTENDKFNFVEDDHCQREYFAQDEKLFDNIEIMRLLFPKITRDEIDKYYENRAIRNELLL